MDGSGGRCGAKILFEFIKDGHPIVAAKNIPQHAEFRVKVIYNL